MDYKNIKTNDLIKKLNRYSFEDKAYLCLKFSFKSFRYLQDYYAGENGISPPWIVDSYITLCILSKPITSFKKDVKIDGVKDKGFIFDALFGQMLTNRDAYKNDLSYFLNPLLIPQINYQKNDDIILYRYNYLFSCLQNEYLKIANNVAFDNFIVLARFFSTFKSRPVPSDGTLAISKELLDLFPEIEVPLSISRDDLISKTYELLDDFNDLSKFSYSFKFVSSYPLVVYNNKCYLLAVHNFLNAITSGFMSRITDSFKDASKLLGIALEKYIYKIIDDSKLVDSLENDSIPYYIRKRECKKPDVSFAQNNKLVIIESKKAWSILKSTYNDIGAVEREIEKGIEACEKSLDNYIRFVNGKYTLCGKRYSEYEKVYLIICVESENYWPRETLIKKIKLKEKYTGYQDFIDNNLIITSLYNIESYFLLGHSILSELERDDKGLEKNSLKKNDGSNMVRGEALQKFVSKDKERYELFKNELVRRVDDKSNLESLLFFAEDSNNK